MKLHTDCKHVMGPDNQAKKYNGHDGIHHGAVSKQRLSGMDREDLAHQAKRGQDHDIDSRMGVKPEKMLINHNISTQGGVEESCVGNDVKAQQKQGAGQYRSG